MHFHLFTYLTFKVLKRMTNLNYRILQIIQKQEVIIVVIVKKPIAQCTQPHNDFTKKNSLKSQHFNVTKFENVCGSFFTF